MKTIAKIYNDYTDKFGIPRQSGLVEEVVSTIVFEEEYRVEEALRGIEAFSHLWLIWRFSRTERDTWSPTVRPPRLGGNTRVGVFATRSPFRPNPIGLSCVRLTAVEKTRDGTVLKVAGADLMNGTPILDIKPYLPYARLSPGERRALTAVLQEDPRPAYQDDPDRVYGFRFGSREVRFRVQDGVLTVTDLEPVSP